MANIFTHTKVNKPKTSTFNMSYDKKLTLNMGNIVPIHIQEILPGDFISMNTQQMLRFMPMVAPVMHEVNVFTHFFFVPNRLMWGNWEKFITGGANPTEGIQPLFPTITIGNSYDNADSHSILPSSLGDYLGLPITQDVNVDVLSKEQVSALPFMAYQKVYNEYYRDQNLIDDLFESDDPLTGAFLDGKLKDGEQDPNIVQSILTPLRKRAWQHDYFTSALPWAQRGESVKIPLFNDDDEEIGISYKNLPDALSGTYIRDPQTGDPIVGRDANLMQTQLGQVAGQNDSGAKSNVDIDNSANLYLDTKESTPNLATVSDLRRAFKLQEWMEKLARTGARYTEVLKAFFGVTSSDARLQRPEFLGGSMSPVMISEVLQTSETGTGTPLADMAGHGLNVGSGKAFSKFFEEHGYIIGVMSVMPKTAYQQGIPRHFSKFDKYDYFWPEFQHIGEQAILNKEVFMGDSKDWNNSTFGYIPRYAEYKYNPSTVHGYFRTSLDFWHLGRIFSNEDQVNLSPDFVECNPRNNIFAVEENDEDHLIAHVFHNIKATRRMSYFGEPKF